MDKSKTEKDFEKWLKDFRKLTGRDVVISLLITKSDISFVNCMDSKRYLDQDYDEDDFNKELKPINVSKKIQLQSYIG